MSLKLLLIDEQFFWESVFTGEFLLVVYVFILVRLGLVFSRFGIRSYRL